MRDIAVEGTVAARIADARNEDGHIEWVCCLKVDDLRAHIANRKERARQHLALEAQIPGLIVRRSEFGFARHVLARRLAE